MIGTGIAAPPDAQRISELLTANAGDRGMLMGRWPVEAIAKRIAGDQRIVIAAGAEDRLLGALLTCERGYYTAPPVAKMLEVWPGGTDSYIYGPVCVAKEARGQGVLEALYVRLRQIFPNREAILFIRADNERSLHAHLKLGMRQVAHFELNGAPFNVLSDRVAQS